MAVGLRLSLDDELSLRCWDEGGSLKLTNVGPIVVRLTDGNWHKGWNCQEGMYDKQEKWKTDPETMKYSPASRLILNPKHEDGPSLVLYWLSNCLFTHKKCLLGFHEIPELPTRVLELGELGKSRKSRLIEANGLHAKYVTLSHCWGTTSHTMALSHDNMEAMKAGIEDSDMPKTFQEAIKITRGVGLQYLWIDSMCIIQPTEGSTSDWEKEGSRMGETYRKSIFTIAASAAKDNFEGCLHGRAASQFDVQPVPLFQRPVHREWDEFSKTMKRNSEWFPLMNPMPTSWLNHVQNSPLNSRAWVLQERILSPRTLHCTMQGFFWECSELRASEYEPLGCDFDYHFRDFGLLNVNTILTEDMQKIVGHHWRQVVERYSQLALSVSTDRLPALAGLAQIVQDRTGDEYVAGHWKSSLVSSLLWCRLDDRATKGKIRTKNAPSWSWASVPGPVKFTPLEKSDYPARDPEDYLLAAELVDLVAEPLGANRNSWVSQSSLWLSGRLHDNTSTGGLPNIQDTSVTADETWHGHLPMKSDIPQMRAIPFRTTKGEFNDLSSSLYPDSDPILEGSSTKTRSISANQPLLEATIKKQMQIVTSSQEWAELEKASKEKKEAQAKRPETVSVSYDEPVPKLYPKSQIALLQILSGHGEHEGLVLLRAESANQYKRIGFFTWKEENAFGNVEKIKVELI